MELLTCPRKLLGSSLLSLLAKGELILKRSGYMARVSNFCNPTVFWLFLPMGLVPWSCSSIMQAPHIEGLVEIFVDS